MFDQRSKTKSITKLSLPLLLAGKQPNYLLAKSLLSPRNIGIAKRRKWRSCYVSATPPPSSPRIKVRRFPPRSESNDSPRSECLRSLLRRRMSKSRRRCIITIPLSGIPSLLRPSRPVTGYLEVSQAWITTRLGCHFDLNVLGKRRRHGRSK